MAGSDNIQPLLCPAELQSATAADAECFLQALNALICYCAVSRCHQVKANRFIIFFQKVNLYFVVFIVSTVSLS